jgi:hypothetical protein
VGTSFLVGVSPGVILTGVGWEWGGLNFIIRYVGTWSAQHIASYTMCAQEGAKRILDCFTEFLAWAGKVKAGNNAFSRTNVPHTSTFLLI